MIHLPDKDHPIWKIIQSSISLISLIIFITHISDGNHHSIETPDFIGLIGSGIATKLGIQYFRS